MKQKKETIEYQNTTLANSKTKGSICVKYTLKEATFHSVQYQYLKN